MENVQHRKRLLVPCYRITLPKRPTFYGRALTWIRTISKA